MDMVWYGMIDKEKEGRKEGRGVVCVIGQKSNIII